MNAILDYIQWAKGLGLRPVEIHVCPEQRQKIIAEGVELGWVAAQPGTHETLFGLKLLDDLMPGETFKLKVSNYPGLV